MMNVQITGFRRLRKGSLIGFCTVELREPPLQIREVGVHRAGDAAWCALPARAQIDAGGTALRNADSGKIEYQTIIRFLDKPSRDEFSHAVLAALLAQFPDAFEESAA
jgi:hypothetical protein